MTNGVGSHGTKEQTETKPQEATTEATQADEGKKPENKPAQDETVKS